MNQPSTPKEPFKPSKKARKWFLTIWLAAILMGICSLFWYNEWVYSLPTPVPVDYQAVKIGQHIDLTTTFPAQDDKPVFLHFFNPKCPCSKFNIPHFKSLVKTYGDKITFAVVVMSKDPYSVDDIQNKFGLDIPVLFDPSIATACGVYSTPQAVLLDNDHNLYYRGNYNRSRYCTDKNSDFARMAIDSLLDHKVDPIFSPLALQSYGCQLPNCNK